MSSRILNKHQVVRTTVSLPVDLTRRSQYFIDAGKIPNRNTLIVTALEHFLDQLEQEEIDKQFAAMSTDAAYQELNLALADSFAESDWEALTEGERHLS